MHHLQTVRCWQQTIAMALIGLLLTSCSHPVEILPEATLRLHHTANVTKFEFSSNGKWLVTAGGDLRVIQWNAHTGKLIRSFAARSFEMAPDGNSLLIIALHGSRQIPTLISLQTGSILQRVDVPYPTAVHLNASLSRDGRYLLIVWGITDWSYLPVKMAVWDMQTNSPLWDPGMPRPFSDDADEWTSSLLDRSEHPRNSSMNSRQKRTL